MLMRIAKFVAFLVIVTIAGLWIFSGFYQTSTDYAQELTEIERDLSALPKKAFAPEALSKRLYLLYQKASLTSDYQDFKAFERAINSVLEQVGPVEQLYLSRAYFQAKMHRLEAAKANLAKLQFLANSGAVRSLQADIALQEGDYEEALAGYEWLLEDHRSWDNLARMAYYKAKTGDPEGADALYVEAQEQLTAKQLRSYAWVELQRGLIDLDYARYEQALAHYQHANRAYSGYWLIEEHIAEVLALLGRTDEAVSLYHNIIEKTNNPEFVSALAFTIERDAPEKAAKLYEKAQALYEQRFRLFPEAAIGHFIEYLLQRKEVNAQLLDLAEENYQLRPNAESLLLFAKAHLKTGHAMKAKALLEKIKKTPWKIPAITQLEKDIGSSVMGGASPSEAVVVNK